MWTLSDRAQQGPHHAQGGRAEGDHRASQGEDQPGVDGSRSNDGDAAIMRDIAEKMSDLEIKAVASFLSGLR